jgi:hypothetical protein
MTAKGLIVQNSFRVGLLIYSFFRNYVSASANVAEQRLGSPYGPVRGTAGSIAGLPLRKPVALAAPGCFCSRTTVNAVIAKSEMRGL